MSRPWRAGCSRRQRKRRRASCSGCNLRQFALTRRSAVGAAGCFREGGRHTAHSPQPRGVGRDANRLLPGRAGPSLQWSQPGDSPRVHQSAPAPHLRIPRALVRRTCTRAEKRSNKPESHFPASWTHRASRWALGLGLQGRPPSTDSRALASRARAGVGRERGLAGELAAGCIYACTLLPGNSERATPAPPTVPPAHSGPAPSLARALSVGRTPQAVPVIAGVLANNSYAPCFVVANKSKCVADAIIPAPAGGSLALLFPGSKPTHAPTVVSGCACTCCATAPRPPRRGRRVAETGKACTGFAPLCAANKGKPCAPIPTLSTLRDATVCNNFP